MSRSVLVRLVTVSLLVAGCSIAATAWLTTTSTRAEFQGDQQRTLERDNTIFNTLLDYSRVHRSWDGVEAVLDSFGDQGDRTITLAAPDGTVIASTDRGLRRAPAGVVPTAVVDPLAAASAVPSTNDATQDDTTGKYLDEATDTEAAPVPDDGSLRALTLVPAHDPSLPATAFALSADELRERNAIIDKSLACAAGMDFPAESTPGHYGGFILDAATSSPLYGTEGVEKLRAVCAPVSADEPGEVYRSVNAAIADSVEACLSANGFDTGVRAGSGESGLRMVVIATDAAGSVSPVAESCRASAVRAAMTERVAPTAQLFLTSLPASKSWLASVGGTRIILTLVAVLVVTLLLAALGARRLLRPIRSLTRATQRMATGDRQARVIVRGGDEIARLGTAFNSMADALHNNERQRQQLTSDIAHELRTPLANVRGYLEGAQDDLVRLDAELVSSLLDETMQLQHLIDDLQDLALADAGRLRVHPEPTNIGTLAERTINAHRGAAEAAGITLTLRECPSLIVDLDPVRIRQALVNLVTNAIRYTPRGGHVDVTVRTSDHGRNLSIAVADTGAGIAREDLPHLFDRFFRADTSRSRATGGSGLGLAVTKHLVDAHHGSVEVRSKLGHGSRFTINLPVTAAEPALVALRPARSLDDTVRADLRAWGDGVRDRADLGHPHRQPARGRRRTPLAGDRRDQRDGSPARSGRAHR